jgi:hypothetical protein
VRGSCGRRDLRRRGPGAGSRVAPPLRALSVPDWSSSSRGRPSSQGVPVRARRRHPPPNAGVRGADVAVVAGTGLPGRLHDAPASRVRGPGRSLEPSWARRRSPKEGTNRRCWGRCRRTGWAFRCRPPRCRRSSRVRVLVIAGVLLGQGIEPEDRSRTGPLTGVRTGPPRNPRPARRESRVVRTSAGLVLVGIPGRHVAAGSAAGVRLAILGEVLRGIPRGLAVLRRVGRIRGNVLPEVRRSPPWSGRPVPARPRRKVGRQIRRHLGPGSGTSRTFLGSGSRGGGSDSPPGCRRPAEQEARGKRVQTCRHPLTRAPGGVALGPTPECVASSRGPVIPHFVGSVSPTGSEEALAEPDHRADGWPPRRGPIAASSGQSRPLRPFNSTARRS